MSDAGNGHTDLDQAITRVESWVERLEAVTHALEKMAVEEKDKKSD